MKKQNLDSLNVRRVPALRGKKRVLDEGNPTPSSNGRNKKQKA
jgi:hypothetical protein